MITNEIGARIEMVVHTLNEFLKNALYIIKFIHIWAWKVAKYYSFYHISYGQDMFSDVGEPGVDLGLLGWCLAKEISGGAPTDTHKIICYSKRIIYCLAIF